jgi:5-methylcytosine-specific restriction endonuclease McrA
MVTKRKPPCPILTKINRFKEDRPASKNNHCERKIQGGINKIINVRRNHFAQCGSKAERKANGDRRTYMFTNAELKKKILDDPRCYITGETFDPYDSTQWSLDHITPKSRGGTNELTNAGQTTRIANQMKSSMTIEELLNMCERILTHNGYRVEK